MLRRSTQSGGSSDSSDNEEQGSYRLRQFSAALGIRADIC